MILCLLLLASPQAIADDQFNGADEFIRAATEHWSVPGVAVAVVKDGKVVFKRGYGVREIGSENKVDTATLFDIASCTKSFTAASVALLVDQGKVDWDDPVSHHLPGIRFPNAYLTRHGNELHDVCYQRENPWKLCATTLA